MRAKNDPIQKHRLFRKLRGLTALLIALPLAGLNMGPAPVAATDSQAQFVVTPQLAAAQMLSGTHQVVNAGPGDQVDPHIACDLVSYTVDDGFLPLQIRYFDFATNTDQPISAPGASHLADVSGSRITLTNVTAATGSQIAIFDTAAQTFFTVPGGGRRVNPAIGGDTVAFEDRSFSTNSNESEMVVYDLAAGGTTRLTADALMDVNPSVSPEGSAIVFQKCQNTGQNCDIYSSVQTMPGVFTTQQLTGEEGDDRNPETDGQIVVYTSNRGGETDIYFQPIVGGSETQISIPGVQRFPTISRNLISFESQVGTQYDVFVYDITSGNLYQVTDTPQEETLSEINFCDGFWRIVYTAPGANGDYDVFAFTFQLDNSAASQIDDLIELVRSYNLHRGTEVSLLAKLHNALAAVNAGNTESACGSLEAFINEVQAQSGNKITPAQAEQLIAGANQIQTALGCQ